MKSTPTLLTKHLWNTLSAKAFTVFGVKHLPNEYTGARVARNENTGLLVKFEF